MKVSFSLAKSKAKPAGAAPPLKQPVVFASLDDEPIDAAPTASSSGHAQGNKQLAAQSAATSGAMRKRMEAEQKVDETVYEYDAVWDKMQEAKLRQKAAKEADSKERKPKYIGGLLTSATQRKLDHLRAEEKMIQREREEEGDEFADKDQFVTQAYKDQMAEVRRAEEEEKKREALEKSKKGVTTGMTHFYRKLLDETEEQHNATVAATLPAPKVIGPQGPAPVNLTITRPLDFAPRSDLEIARAAQETGKDVELNDDNQIVDKRELLSAGLNLSAPNTRRLGLRLMGAGAKAGDQGQVGVHRAVGTAASRREINERRMREIEQQLEEEKERARREKEQQERGRAERIVAKRNTEEDVQSAKERYLQRKKRRIEEVSGVTDGDGSGDGGTE